MNRLKSQYSNHFKAHEMKSICRQFCLFILLLLIFSSRGTCQIHLPKLVGDGMVLQRNAKISIWGWAAPNEKITVRFLDTRYKTKANHNGEWSVIFKDLEAGGPHTMTIEASNSITLHDILIGDVWVCSGQSQMDINMQRVSPLYEEEIKNAGNDKIRYFVVPTVFNFQGPQQDLPSGKWESISQNNILSVSAIAYFFADELFQKYKVPIGMIRSSLGGSPAEAWMSEEALKEFPEHLEEALKHKDTAYIQGIQQADRNRIGSWYRRSFENDKGYQDPKAPWTEPEVDVSEWPVMKVPGYYSDGELGMTNGVIWFRKDVDLPPEFAGKPAKLNMGRIVDADSVFVNGVFVGSVGYQYPPRRYTVPENVLKSGVNTIVVRLISNMGKGGFVPDNPYELIVGNKTIDLKGEWHYHLGTQMEPLQGQTFFRWKPTGLFNGMIAPLTNYIVKGVLWYQGESNAGRPDEYARLFPALIQDWKNHWKQDELPFLFVQLHNFMETKDQPSDSYWARTREAQLKALELPNTGMAVAIDLGVWNDIHPLNKKDVAKRLALTAYKKVYHEEDVVLSPLYESMQVLGDSILITFTETGSGLIAKGGGELKYFAIASADMHFVWAKAKISGNKVIVWNDKIQKPVAVRYAWADNPEGANLYNKEGLPASPFRTDDWTYKNE